MKVCAARMRSFQVLITCTEINKLAQKYQAGLEKGNARETLTRPRCSVEPKREVTEVIDLTADDSGDDATLHAAS